MLAHQKIGWDNHALRNTHLNRGRCERSNETLLMTMNLLLKCGRVAETKAFYSEILGFKVSDSAEGTCTVQKEGGTIIFSDAALWAGPPHCTGTIYFFLADVDRYYDEIKTKAIVRWPFCFSLLTR